MGRAICDLDCAILNIYERLWTSLLLTLIPKVDTQSLSIPLGLL